jgi:nucleoid DNA-binding protein
MTKADIVDRVAEKMSLKKEESFEIVELVLEIMREH